MRAVLKMDHGGKGEGGESDRKDQEKKGKR